MREGVQRAARLMAPIPRTLLLAFSARKFCKDCIKLRIKFIWGERVLSASKLVFDMRIPLRHI